MIASKRILAGLVLASLGSAPAPAQTSIDIAKITCEQFILQQVTNPRNVITWLSGYYAKRGDTIVQVQQFEENANKVTDACRANLKGTVMEVFEKVVQPTRQ
jgi:acid stress chaperone HdeB